MTKPLTKEQEDYLNHLYYQQYFMFGRDRIYQRAKEDNIKISLRQIMNWLKNQEVHQLFTKTYKTKNIKSTIMKEPNKQIAIDLIDMTKYEYDNYKYIFTAIDLFSKKVYATALYTKDKAYLGLIDLIDKMDDHISSIRSDNGTEFTNEKFTDILEENNIKQVLSRPHAPQSNGNIERFNGTIKKLIKMYMKSNNTYDWVKVLPQLIDNYNNSVNSVTKKIPNDITVDDHKEIENNIKESVTKERSQDTIKFNVNDRVRIKLEIPNDDGELWSKKIYKIIEVNKPKTRVSSVYYSLLGIRKRFYNNDLQLINSVENKINEEEEFVVSRIIRPYMQNNKQYYLIKWKGYSDKYNTYEPRNRLMEDIPKLINRFEKKHNVVWHKDKVTFDEEK